MPAPTESGNGGDPFPGGGGKFDMRPCRTAGGGGGLSRCIELLSVRPTAI